MQPIWADGVARAECVLALNAHRRIHEPAADTIDGAVF